MFRNGVLKILLEIRVQAERPALSYCNNPGEMMGAWVWIRAELLLVVKFCYVLKASLIEFADGLNVNVRQK